MLDQYRDAVHDAIFSDTGNFVSYVCSCRLSRHGTAVIKLITTSSYCYIPRHWLCEAFAEVYREVLKCASK